MKKTYEKPEVKALEIKKEDIITGSDTYMLPLMPASDENTGDKQS